MGSSCSPESPPNPGGREDAFPRPHFLPKGQLRGHTPRPKQGLCGEEGKGHAKVVWTWEGSLDKAAGKFPGNTLLPRAALSVATGGVWALAGPTWSFPIPSHFLLLPHS